MPGSSNIPVTTPAVAAAASANGKALIDLVALVRARFRDYPELNVLTAGYEHSDRDIAIALADGISDWNTTPPLLDNITFASHPAQNLLVDYAITRLLSSESFRQVRNQLMIQDDQGRMAGINDKGPQLMSWAAMLLQAYEAKKRSLKIAINLNGSMNGSGINSEYDMVNVMFNLAGSRSPT